MQITHPADGASFPVTHPVSFDGDASAKARTVVLRADNTFDIGRATVENRRWTVVRQFSASGRRSIEARELDGQGEIIGSRTITIHLEEPHSLGYNPPIAMRDHLGGVLNLVEQSTQLTPPLKGLEFMCLLPGGELFFQSDLDLDTDGKRDPGITYEPTHQPQTSIDPQGAVVSSNSTPFIVLPGGFFSQFGIRLGDAAVVLYRNKVEYAVLADTGPTSKIGEGSIALHRSLGFERIRSNGHILDSGIEGGVVTIVFPGSGNGKAQTPDAIRALGKAAFAALGGRA